MRKKIFLFLPLILLSIATVRGDEIPTCSPSDSPTCLPSEKPLNATNSSCAVPAVTPTGPACAEIPATKPFDLDGCRKLCQCAESVWTQRDALTNNNKIPGGVHDSCGNEVPISMKDTYCAAFLGLDPERAGSPIIYDSVMLAVDVALTAVCSGGCFGYGGPALDAICMAMGVGSMVTDTIYGWVQNSSPTANFISSMTDGDQENGEVDVADSTKKYLGDTGSNEAEGGMMVPGAAVVVGGGVLMYTDSKVIKPEVKTAKTNLKSAQDNYSTLRMKHDSAASNHKLNLNRKASQGTLSKSADDLVESSKAASQASNLCNGAQSCMDAALKKEKTFKKVNKIASCGMLAISVAMTSLRAANIGTLDAVFKSTCDNLNSLQASRFQKKPFYSQFDWNIISKAMANTNPGSGSRLSDATVEKLNGFGACIMQEGTDDAACARRFDLAPMVSLDSPDGQFLGMKRDALAQVLKQLPGFQFGTVAQIALTQGVTTAASMLTPGATPEGIAQLAEIEQMVKQDLLPSASLGRPSTSGVNTFIQKQMSEKSQHRVFGQNPHQGPLGGKSNMAPAYSNQPDIWHEHTDMNIFQIVSKKFQNVQNRVAPAK